jgi:tetratricopeptide (TPR) repeat protein
MDPDHAHDQLRPGTWIRMSGFGAKDLICFTYVDPAKGLCAKGGQPDDPDLAERPTDTIHSLSRWPALRWHALDSDDIERSGLPAQPTWLRSYGPQPHPDATWDPQLDEPDLADRAWTRSAGAGTARASSADRTRPVRPDWQIGDNIGGRFSIEQIVGGPGRSGMGTVYVGRDSLLGGVCALKTLQDRFLEDQAMHARFRREALAWIRLDAHDNITQAYQWEYLDNRPCLLMEYVAGGDLGQWIGSPLLTDHPDVCVRLAMDFCDGMIHASGKGIRAHRDVKPQNCLLTAGRTPRLLVTDFGLASLTDDRSPDGRPAADLPVHRPGGWHASGTCTHMSPEQFDDSRSVDVRADVYAFGVLLFQMLTGSLPFPGRTWEELRRSHRTVPPPSLPLRFGRILDALVRTCLAKDPDARYPDFTPIRQQLAEAYRQQTGGRPHEAGRSRALDVQQRSRKAMSLVFLGDAEAALQLYEQAIAADPRGSLAERIGKTAALRSLGRYSEALAAIDGALRLHAPSGEAFAWLSKGEVLRAMQRYEQALTCYARAAELDPGLDLSWAGRGALLFQLGRYSEAADCYERLLELDPDDPDSCWYAGEALRRSGRELDALAKFNSAISVKPGHYRAWTSRALSLAALGGPHDGDTEAQALYCMDRALATAPADSDVWFCKGSLLIWYRRQEDAVGCFVRAQQLGHRSAAAMIETLREKHRRQDR